MTRPEVYKAIDSERNFQEQLTANPLRPDMIENFHVGDGLSGIEYNLIKAREAWYKGAVPHTEAMEYLRKVAGVIVKLAEEYGIPERK